MVIIYIMKNKATLSLYGDDGYYNYNNAGLPS